jgi:type II secretory ATPase GspE/PulE/Tfp pilus assembly ATPase PilB-like protein
MAASLHGVAFRRRRGCARCGETGYRGRVGVFQLLTMSERLEQLAAEKAPREEIERIAAEEGMRTMWEDGVGKVAAGITSVEELARVCTV